MRISFVAPFYGPVAAGGAEAECRQTAHRLARVGVQVDVLTTCLLDLQHDWNINVHAAGVSMDGPVRVHRFRVEPSDLSPFGELNRRLLAREILTPLEEEMFAALHITSFDLLRYLANHAAAYHRILFIPYLFGTTLYGLPLCGDRAVLIPCLHDEGYARMSLVRRVFEVARHIVFHTRAEQSLARRLFGAAAEKGVVLGEGVDADFPSDPSAFRTKYRIVEPFILYAGRKDSTKNTDRLVAYFSQYARAHANHLKLVFIGPGHVAIPSDVAHRIVDLGYVPESDKRNAYAAALALCQPSLNESFSLVMMEAWACGTPCLVSEACEVTREHVKACGGGLYFRDYADFEGILDYFLAHASETKAMGDAGKQYVRQNFSWPHITERYLELLQR